MAQSPYRGFKPLNDRRLELITKLHTWGIGDDEKRELKMLEDCTDAMLEFRWPHKTWSELAEMMDRLNFRK